MGGGHTHAHDAGEGGDLRVVPRARTALVTAVVLVILGVAGGMVALWPTGPAPRAAALPGTLQADEYAGTITRVTRHDCSGLPDDRLPDGTIPTTVACADLAVRLDDGPKAGTEVTVQVAGPQVQAGLGVGTAVRVSRFPAVDAAPESYAFADVDRRFPLALLGGLFVLVVLALARWRGLAALVGVGAGFAMVLFFLLPALRRGENPALVALVGCVAVMVVVLYASHGVSAKTTVALLGTVLGLGVTTGLAAWASSAAHLTGAVSEDGLALTQLVGTASMRGMVLAGMVLAGLGVLNDVTVTQASAVWELRAAAPSLTAPALFRRAMAIGRDHLASTVYTVAFAYAGTSLATLMLVSVYERPLGQVVLSGAVAQEVIGILTGGIGLGLAIPLTTLIAVLAARGATVHGRDARPSPDLPSEPQDFVEGVLVRRRSRRTAGTA